MHVKIKDRCVMYKQIRIRNFTELKQVILRKYK